jgi:hypothetical protein
MIPDDLDPVSFCTGVVALLIGCGVAVLYRLLRMKPRPIVLDPADAWVWSVVAVLRRDGVYRIGTGTPWHVRRAPDGDYIVCLPGVEQGSEEVGRFDTDRDLAACLGAWYNGPAGRRYRGRQ